VEALVRLGEPSVGPLVDVLRDGDPDVRWSAADALGRIGHAGGVVPLITALRDSRWLLREAAAKALGRIEDSRAAEPLVGALRDPEWLVRKAAAEALRAAGMATDGRPPAGPAFGGAARMGSRRCVRNGRHRAPLRRPRRSDAHVRESAAEAFGRVSDPAAVAALVAALKDKDPRVQRAAAVSLGRLGAEAREALDALAAVSGATDDKLAKAATEAADRIRRATALA